MSETVITKDPVTEASVAGEPKNPTQLRADCCIVGGGPAGVMLGLLLARKGVQTLLLEAHQDFNRDFRGDTIHPSTLDLMDQLGLTERLLEIKHAKMRRMTLRSGDQAFTMADLGSLKVRHPFVAVLPQAQFLEFIVHEAKKYPNFNVLMGARAEQLVEREGIVQGVRYNASGGQFEALAHLTVAADGRGSHLAKLAGLEPVKKSPPMDVYWFTLPRRPDDDEEGLLGFRVADGKMLVLFARYDAWQVGYVMLKGRAHELQAEGIESFQRSLRKLVPEFGDRVEDFRDWRQARYLTVESSRIARWYKAGLLLIGDAAHVMSPVGGVGINYAIQDAVAAANLLGGRLKAGP